MKQQKFIFKHSRRSEQMEYQKSSLVKSSDLEVGGTLTRDQI